MRMGTNGTRESLMFLIDLEKALEKYYKDDWNYMRRRIVFLFDNASLHLSPSIYEFFTKRKLLAFTIP